VFPRFSVLTALTRLDISDIRSSDDVPRRIDAASIRGLMLPSLRVLSVDDFTFPTGAASVLAGLRELTRLTSLGLFFLGSGMPRNLDAIPMLTNLQNLTIDGAMQLELLQLTALARLASLSVFVDRLTDEFFWGFSALSRLRTFLWDDVGSCTCSCLRHLTPALDGTLADS
jgi:hypothetical protein